MKLAKYVVILDTVPVKPEYTLLINHIYQWVLTNEYDKRNKLVVIPDNTIGFIFSEYHQFSGEHCAFHLQWAKENRLKVSSEMIWLSSAIEKAVVKLTFPDMFIVDFNDFMKV